MIPSQMLKGTLEGCILKVISHKETYGYEISEKLKEYGFFDISEGTIYPLLLRLEKNGLLTKIENPTDGRSAYLALNEKALALLEALRAASDQVNQEAFDIFNEAELANLTSYLTRLMDHISERY